MSDIYYEINLQTSLQAITSEERALVWFRSLGSLLYYSFFGLVYLYLITGGTIGGAIN